MERPTKEDVDVHFAKGYAPVAPAVVVYVNTHSLASIRNVIKKTRTPRHGTSVDSHKVAAFGPDVLIVGGAQFCRRRRLLLLFPLRIQKKSSWVTGAFFLSSRYLSHDPIRLLLLCFVVVFLLLLLSLSLTK